MDYFISLDTNKEKEEFLKTRVDSLVLSNNIKKILLESGIRTVRGLISKTPSELIERFSFNEVNLANIAKSFDNLVNKIRGNVRTVSDFEDASSVPISSQKIEYIEGERIIDMFAIHFNIEKKFLVGVGRQQDIVKVRDITVYILRKYGGLSFPAIGKLLGNRDHTTIIHAFRKIEAQAKVSKDFEYESYNLIAEARKLKARVLETERLSTPSLTSFARSGVSIKNFSKPIEISQRSNKVLNLYRQGLVLQDIGEKIGVTRERARQIIVKTIKQKAFNESLRKGVKVDFETLLTREKEIRRLAIESNKPIKLPKQAKIRGWSLYHDSCKSCGTTEVKHFVHGLCEDCGNKSITGDAREQMVSDHNNKCDLCNISREQAIKDYGRDFYLSRKLKSVLCRRCFLEEMGKKLADTKRNKWKMFYN